MPPRGVGNVPVSMRPRAAIDAPADQRAAVEAGVGAWVAGCAAACVAGAAGAADAQQPSTITAVLATVQPQPVRQWPQASRHV